ncbi:MAG: LON peptidase substrate-binding domain-containing protein, partial [Anaerolineae bacterium]|nr:LON peptidase substrate-binding domain-containing protein [Anaerolineae bacterium]
MTSDEKTKAEIPVIDETAPVEEIPVGELEDIPEVQEDIHIPANLPILPLRGLVVFPHTAMPLTVGQARSLKLVDEVATSEDRIIGLFSARDPHLETPGPDDIHRIGT